MDYQEMFNLAVTVAAFFGGFRLAMSAGSIGASEPGGTPIAEEQLAYRASLRTMDDAEDFDPFNPVWPEEPA